MGTKIKVDIKVNNIKGGIRFCYSYDKIEFSIRIAKNGFRIDFLTTSKNLDSPDKVWKSKHIDDAVRKCMLVQLLIFGKCSTMKETEIIVEKNKAQATQKFREKLVYSLIEGKLLRSLGDVSDKRLIEKYISFCSTKYDNRIAALFAYLNSKSKDKELERFYFLWTSLNGMYGYYSTRQDLKNIREKFLSKKYTKVVTKLSEQQELLFCKYIFGLGDESINLAKNNCSRKDRERFNGQFLTILRQSNISVEKLQKAITELDIAKRDRQLRILFNDRFGFFDNGRLNYNNIIVNTTFYGYVLFELAYYIRCKYIHGNKPILLFCNLNSLEYRTLVFINTILEDFIDKNLKYIF